MTDLDARVAALMALADTYYTTNTLSGFDFRAAIRAELQKPEMHEPCTQEEAARVLAHLHYQGAPAVTMKSVRIAVDSVLQGRAKPAPRIPFAGYDPTFCPGSDPNNPQEEKPAQEEIRDEQITKARAALDDLDDFARMPISVRPIGAAKVLEDFIDKIAAIRASKGEKT